MGSPLTDKKDDKQITRIFKAINIKIFDTKFQ